MARAMEQGNLPQTVFINDHLSAQMQQSQKLYLGLTALSLQKDIAFRYEVPKGFWIRSTLKGKG